MTKGLSWEWGDDDGHSIIIKKKKGKITCDDIWQFMHERELLNMFEGDLVMWFFRPSTEREFYGMDDRRDEGDAQMLQIVQDGDPCPICGKNILFPQYCPKCGEKLRQPKE